MDNVCCGGACCGVIAIRRLFPVKLREGSTHNIWSQPRIQTTTVLPETAYVEWDPAYIAQRSLCPNLGRVELQAGPLGPAQSDSLKKIHRQT